MVNAIFFVKPLNRSWKLYTSVTFWWLNSKSLVVVYRAKSMKIYCHWLNAYGPQCIIYYLHIVNGFCRHVCWLWIILVTDLKIFYCPFFCSHKNACVDFYQLTDSPKEYGIPERPTWCKLEGWMLLMLDIHHSSQMANSVSGPAGWVKLLFTGNRKRLKCNHWCVNIDCIRWLTQLISFLPYTYRNCNMPQWPKTLIRTLCKWLFTCKILPHN